MFKRIILIVAISLFIFSAGSLSFASDCCAGKSDSAHKAAGKIQAAANNHGKASCPYLAAQGPVNAGNKICPVTAEEIGEGMEQVTYEYKGKIYNLCCEMCIDKFKKDPDKYVKKVNVDKV
jgi:YHS domain-containing protein